MQGEEGILSEQVTTPNSPIGNEHQQSTALVSRWRRGTWSAVAILIAILAVYAWLVTYGTWNFAGEETWGTAFDSLGKSLLAGHANVDPDAISWEGFNENGKTFISFGPFPAMLRIVPNAIFPGMYGRWSRLSCLLGAWLSLLAAILAMAPGLPWLERGPDRRTEFLVFTTVAVGFGLGTPLAYLVSCGRIYHEAVIWGLCGSLWGIFFMLRILRGPGSSGKEFLGLSVSFAVALLSRVTFGIPIALGLVILGVRQARAYVAPSRPRGKKVGDLFRLLLWASPALAAGLFLLWYDYARFGSIWKTFDFAATYVFPDKIGGVMNVARVPSALWNYFGFTTASLSAQPPFFQLAQVKYLNDAIFFGWKEQTLSLTLGSCWLVFAAALGLLSVLRRWRSWEFAVSLAFLPEIAVIVSFYFVTQRYAAEFLPILVFLFALFLRDGARTARLGGRFAFLLLGLAVLSAGVTVASTLQWNMVDNGDVPREYKARLARLIGRSGHVSDWKGPRVSLLDLKPVQQSYSFAAARFGATWDDFPILLGNRFFARGIGMHAISRISYAVPEGATAFCAVVGLPGSSASCRVGSVVFELRDESDALLFRTGVVRAGDKPVRIDLHLHGAKEIALVVTDAGDGIDCDHGTWGDPVFLLPPHSQ